MDKISFHKSYLLPLLFLFFAINSAYAQKKNHAVPLRLDFRVPKALTNEGYRNTFSGVFDMGISVGYCYRNISVAPFFRTMLFEIPARFVIRAKMLQRIQNTGIRFGYDHTFSGNKFIITPGIDIGYNWIKYQDTAKLKPIPDENKRVNAINISPTVGIKYFIENGFGIGITFAYNNLNYVFDPYPLLLDKHRSYAKEDITKNTRIFSFGFSVYYDFLTKSDDNEDL